MTHVSNEVLEKRKTQLLEEKKRILARMNEMRAQDPFNNPDRLNDNAASDAEASEEAGHDRTTAILEELAQQVKDIDAALARIEKGTYGHCAVCGDPIDSQRLEILPTATLCHSCEAAKSK